MNVVPFEYLVAREVRSRRFEVLRCLPCDSCPSDEVGGRFFVEFGPRRGVAAGPRDSIHEDGVFTSQRHRDAVDATPKKINRRRDPRRAAQATSTALH